MRHGTYTSVPARMNESRHTQALEQANQHVTLHMTEPRHI